MALASLSSLAAAPPNSCAVVMGDMLAARVAIGTPCVAYPATSGSRTLRHTTYLKDTATFTPRRGDDVRVARCQRLILPTCVQHLGGRATATHDNNSNSVSRIRHFDL